MLQDTLWLTRFAHLHNRLHLFMCMHVPAHVYVYVYKAGNFLRVSVHDVFNFTFTQAIYRAGTNNC